MRSAWVLVSAALAALAAPAAAAPSAPIEATPAETPLACGTRLTADQFARYVLSGEELAPTPPDRTRHYVPIAAHIVRRSNGEGGLPEARFHQALADANQHFAEAQIVFYQHGPIDYIDDDSLYHTETISDIDRLRTTNSVPNAINAYFTEILNYDGLEICGISSFTFHDVQGIAMRNWCTARDTGVGDHSTFSHELGHYFDLMHTHDTQWGGELANGLNCSVAGDRLCDTPADPGLTPDLVDANCEYVGELTDITGTPYDPDPSLLMSYSRTYCRQRFTPDSLTRARTTLVQRRPELVHDSAVALRPGRGEANASLGAPRPNPAAGLSELSFSLRSGAEVEVSIYDVHGRRVRTIARAPYAAGEHTIGWNGRDESGWGVADGVYFARLRAGEEIVVRKLQRISRP